MAPQHGSNTKRLDEAQVLSIPKELVNLLNTLSDSMQHISETVTETQQSVRENQLKGKALVASVQQVVERQSQLERKMDITRGSGLPTNIDEASTTTSDGHRLERELDNRYSAHTPPGHVDRNIAQRYESRHNARGGYNSDRGYRDRFYEKNIPVWANNPLLKEAKTSLEWLFNLRSLADTRQWSDEEYVRYLPILFRHHREGRESHELFQSLDEDVRSNSLKLELAFLKRYCRTSLRNAIRDLGSKVQEDQRSEDFLRSLIRLKRMLERWRPNLVMPDSYLVQTLEHRFTKPKMRELVKDVFYEASITPRSPVTLELLLALTEQADYHDEPDVDTAVRIERVRRDQPSDYYTHVRSVMLENDVVGGYNDEDRVMEVVIEESIYNMGRYPTPAVVARIQRSRKRPPPVEERNESDMKCYDAVVGQKHTENGQEQLCAFFATVGRCTHQHRCRHKHERRVEQQCTTANCTSGAFCKYRHAGDMYDVWFYDRDRRTYKRYLWKDRVSSFSIYMR